MELTITFPGGKRVDAKLKDQVVCTDQSPAAGGQGTAPEPYLLFLASIGTCAGIYALAYCQARSLPTEGLRLTQRVEFDPTKHRLAKVQLEIQVPSSFEEKHRKGIIRAADSCAVKKALLDPPAFEVFTSVAGEEESERKAS